ncbi:unnamed protein product [Orchesella dallaii]|uniref:DM domain-containing protein n=1 Tax=Orchesella dallaii TaxID=48710 RepID=A0ABP1S6V2_9HEXA
MSRQNIQRNESDILGNTPDSSTKSCNSSTLNLKLCKERIRKPPMKSRHPNCALCQNHGKIVRTKGHKRYCPWRECGCEKCNFTKYRRKVVASQIAVRRAMIEDQEREMMEEEGDDGPDAEKDNSAEKGYPTHKNEEHHRQLPKSAASTSFSTPYSAPLFSLRDGNQREFQEGLHERTTSFLGSLPTFINSRDHLKSLNPESMFGFQSAKSTESVYHIRESIQTLNNMFCLPYGTYYPMHRMWHDFGGNFKLAASKIFEAQYGHRKQKDAQTHFGRYSANRSPTESTNELTISNPSDADTRERLE